MRKTLLSLILIIPVMMSSFSMAQDNPIVVMETNKGTITIELWADKAPISVENFLRYTDNSFYDGMIFHRVIPGFMAQGGGFDPEMVQKSTYDTIKNEASASVPNNRGTLAMARTNVVDSATAQFFINVVDNGGLDQPRDGAGYAVFGKVAKGQDIVEKIRTTPTAVSYTHLTLPTIYSV